MSLMAEDTKRDIITRTQYPSPQKIHIILVSNHLANADHRSDPSAGSSTCLLGFGLFVHKAHVLLVAGTFK